jgi:hypothetical protein
VDQALNFLVAVRNAGHALVRLNADQKGAAIGVRHGRDNAGDFPGQILFGLLL